MTVLVVGGHGFIGHHLCNRLKHLEIDFDIFDLDCPTGNPSKELKAQRKIGLPDSISTDELVIKHYSVVYHLGSLAGVRGSFTEDDYEYYNNVLLNYILNVDFDRIVYISSSSVLGNTESPYSRSKVLAEKQIKESGKVWSIVRPFTVYGDNGRPDMLITRLLNKEKIVVNGNPALIERYFTFVGDLVDEIINSHTYHTTNVIGFKYRLDEVLELLKADFTIGEIDKRDFTDYIFKDDLNIYTKTRIEDYLLTKR
jgi:UDP-glucose 4-epimerase